MAWILPDPDQPLDTLPAEPPEYTLGWGILYWGLTRFLQPEGPDVGKPFVPTHRQTLFLLHAYAVDEEGRFINRHLVRRLAKGSGKSPFAAYLACVEFLGPVRFSHFDPSVRGGVVGKPESMALVQLAASSEAQAKNTSRYVRKFVGRGSILQQEFDLDPGKMVTYSPDGSELQVITSSSTTAEGAQPSFVIADETEHWTPNKGLVELYETLDRNVGKRPGARILETCNAFSPGKESVAELTWQAFDHQQNGRTRGTTKILYDAIEAPADTVLSDEESLRHAIALVYGDIHWQDQQGILEKIWAPNFDPAKARRFYLNQRVADSAAWVSLADWETLTDSTRVVESGEDVVLFFDGSRTSDATALVGCCMSDGHIFTINVWEPDPNDPESVVPIAEVDQAVNFAFSYYNVLAFHADVQEWESFVHVDWREEYGDQLLLWAVPTGKSPEPIAWDMRSHKFDFVKAVELAESQIKEKAFTHDGNAVTARHISNARKRPSRLGVSIGKETPDSPRKIDAAVSVIGALMVRRLVLNSKAYAELSEPNMGVMFI